MATEGFAAPPEGNDWGALLSSQPGPLPNESALSNEASVRSVADVALSLRITSAELNALSVTSQDISVLSSQLSTVSVAVTSVDQHASAASAAATSVDSRLNNVSAMSGAVSTVGLQSVVDALSGRISALGNTGTGVSRLISGGGVAWTGTGFNYIISAAIYEINGVQYTSAQTPVTLDPSDPSLDRHDTFYVDSSGLAGVLTGVAGSGIAPSVDPATQLLLTTADIPAGSSQPTITNEDIYLEDTEYTMSTNSGNIVLNSTNNPFAGTKDVEGTATITGNLFTAVKPSGTLDLSQYSQLVFQIRSKALWPNGRGISIFWMNGAVVVGTSVSLKNGTFGFDSSNTSSYQQIVIPTSLFGAGSAAIDRLRMSVSGSGAATGWYIDNIILQAGGGGGGGGDITRAEFDALSNKVSVLSSQVSTVSLAVTSADNHASAASAAATSVDNRLNTVSQQVSVLSQAVSVISQAHSVLSQQVSVLSGQVSTVSVAVTSADTHASVASAAATSADNHASVASAAATSADNHANTVSVIFQGAINTLSGRIDSVSQQVSVVSQSVSVLSQKVSVISQSLSGMSAQLANVSAMSVGGVSTVGLQSVVDALSNRISAAAGGGGSVTSQHISILSSQVSAVSVAVTSVDTRLNTVSQQVSVLSQGQSVLSQSVSVLSQSVSVLSQAVSVLSVAANPYITFTTQTDTDYTLVLADKQTGVKMNSSSAHNLTVPPNSSVAFPTGTQIIIEQAGSGAVTIVAGSGVTLHGSLVLSNQYATAALIKEATDTWLVAIIPDVVSLVQVASAAATSIDTRLNTVSQQVSVLSQAHSVLSGQVSTVSVAVTSVDARLNTVSQQVSVLSQAHSVLSQAVSVLSQQVSVLSQATSVLSQAHSALSAGLGTVQMKVTADLQGVSSTAATGIKISGLSISVAASGVYQLDAKLLYSTSGTVNVHGFGMSASGATFGAIGGRWIDIVSINNRGVAGNTDIGTFNAINSPQVSILPGTTGVMAQATMDALVVVSTTGGTVRLKARVSVSTAPLNIVRGYFRAYKIA